MKRWSQPTALDGVNVVRYITVPNPFACRLGKSQVRLGHSISPDASLRHRKCLEGAGHPTPFNVLSLFVVCLFVPQRHEHDCSPVVHACVRVLFRGSRPTSRPTPVISRIKFPLAPIINCLTNTWLWPFIMCFVRTPPSTQGVLLLVALHSRIATALPSYSRAGESRR